MGHKTSSDINVSKKKNNNVEIKQFENADTVSTNEIYVTDSLMEKLIITEKERRLNEAVKKFDVLKDELQELVKNDWVKIKNKDVYYLNSENIILPNLKTFNCSESIICYTYKGEKFLNKFEGFIGALPSLKQLKRIFGKNSPFRNDNSIQINNTSAYFTYYDYYYDYCKCVYWDNFKFDRFFSFSSSYFYSSINIPVKKIHNNIKEFIIYKLLPEGLSNEAENLFKQILSMFENSYIELNSNEITVTELYKQKVYQDEIEMLNGISLKQEDIKEYLKLNPISLTEETKKIFLDELLNCDKVRADIEPYDEKRLEDPNLGHWDLWNKDEDEEIEKIKLITDTTFVGRNPLADINEDGLIGIDFGTKSTIVVYQDGDDNTAPMRVGMGQFSKKVEAKHFENPTVMEFINLNEFIDSYNEKKGRPDTLWEDVTISHTAFNSLIASKSDDYYSYFSDLKQWCGDKNRQIKIRDKNQNERLLPAYLDIKEGDFDPIEIYAYYIGLYINNMHNGIYLDYLLSFPVTYEKAVREKIISSFQRGLKKSLPVEVLNDKKAMNKFRVAQGASEPAAYAICALEEYGFDPEDGEKVFYGIFDFGGGTTDFDFGIWRSADEDKESRYDYVINHFGAGGDQYLGGENLLELLAFEVFKDNQDKLREEKIAFLKPAECKKFAGSEVLLSDSQEAKLNIKQLMEKIRPLWERQEGYEKIFDTGVIKVNLFDKSGNPKMNYELNVSMEKLEQIIHDRIEKGVRNFFESLKLTFNSELTKDMESIVIFLAGNSSKSPIVRELFDKYINDITSELNKQSSDEKQYFKIYPPLGSDEAVRIQKENGIDLDETDITRPTGKTGVAYGLIEGRNGGVIKVISEKKCDDEIKFNYYIGRNRKKKFKTIIDRDIEYNKWVKFITADAEDFELYYTNLPEATTNSLSIKEISKKNVRIDNVNEEAFVYIRAVEPSVIEYVAATEDDINSADIEKKVTRIELK